MDLPDHILLRIFEFVAVHKSQRWWITSFYRRPSTTTKSRVWQDWELDHSVGSVAAATASTTTPQPINSGRPLPSPASQIGTGPQPIKRP